MIHTKQDLKFFIAADRIMNGLPPNRSIKEIIIGLFEPNYRGGDCQVLTCITQICLFPKLIKEKDFSIVHNAGVLALKI